MSMVEIPDAEPIQQPLISPQKDPLKAERSRKVNKQLISQKISAFMPEFCPKPPPLPSPKADSLATEIHNTKFSLRTNSFTEMSVFKTVFESKEHASINKNEHDKLLNADDSLSESEKDMLALKSPDFYSTNSSKLTDNSPILSEPSRIELCSLIFDSTESDPLQSTDLAPLILPGTEPSPLISPRDGDTDQLISDDLSQSCDPADYLSVQITEDGSEAFSETAEEEDFLESEEETNGQESVTLVKLEVKEEPIDGDYPYDPISISGIHIVFFPYWDNFRSFKIPYLTKHKKYQVRGGGWRGGHD